MAAAEGSHRPVSAGENKHAVDSNLEEVLSQILVACLVLRTSGDFWPFWALLKGLLGIILFYPRDPTIPSRHLKPIKPGAKHSKTATFLGGIGIPRDGFVSPKKKSTEKC